MSSTSPSLNNTKPNTQVELHISCRYACGDATLDCSLSAPVFSIPYYLFPINPIYSPQRPGQDGCHERKRPKYDGMILQAYIRADIHTYIHIYVYTYFFPNCSGCGLTSVAHDKQSLRGGARMKMHAFISTSHLASWAQTPIVFFWAFHLTWHHF